MRPDPRQRLLILITYFSGSDSVRARLAEWRLVTFLTLFKVQLSLTAWGHEGQFLSRRPNADETKKGWKADAASCSNVGA